MRSKGMNDQATPKRPMTYPRYAELDDLYAYLPPRIALSTRAESVWSIFSGAAIRGTCSLQGLNCQDSHSWHLPGVAW